MLAHSFAATVDHDYPELLTLKEVASFRYLPIFFP